MAGWMNEGGARSVEMHADREFIALTVSSGIGMMPPRREKRNVPDTPGKVSNADEIIHHRL